MKTHRKGLLTSKYRTEVPKGLFRVPIALTKEMENWLQGLANTMRASGGYKLPRSYIVRALINAAMQLKLDVSGVKDEKELTERFKIAIKNFNR